MTEPTRKIDPTTFLLNMRKAEQQTRRYGVTEQQSTAPVLSPTEGPSEEMRQVMQQTLKRFTEVL